MKDEGVGTGIKEQVLAIEPVQKEAGTEPAIRIVEDGPEKLRVAAAKKVAGVDDIVNYFRVSVMVSVQGTNYAKLFTTDLKGFEDAPKDFLVDTNDMEAVEIDITREVGVVADRKATTGIVIGTVNGSGDMVKIVVDDTNLITIGNPNVCELVGVCVMLDVPVTDAEQVFFPDTNEKDDDIRAVVEPIIMEDVPSLKVPVNTVIPTDEPPKISNANAKIYLCGRI